MTATNTTQLFPVKVYPFREKIGMGNIIWAERDRGSAYYRVSKFAMRNGKFPPDHPVGDEGESIKRFREMGYWASCFPEGDGITWRPLNEQPDEQCMADIKAAFGFDARWGA